MRASTLFCALAVVLWAAALLPLPRRGRTFWLVDASASAGGPAAAVGALRELAAADERSFLFASGVAAAGAPARTWPPPQESRLGEALLAVRERLRPGDRLLVWTDGRATDPLPPVGDFTGVAVAWRPAPRQPRIASVDAPASWPPAAALQLRVELADADLAAGRLEVEARPLGSLESAEVQPFGPGTLAVKLRAPAPPRGPVDLRLAWIQDGRTDRRTVHLAPPGKVPCWSPEAGLRETLLREPRVEALPEYHPGAAVLAGAWEPTLEELADWLRQGSPVILASPHAADWLRLPPPVRPFAPAPLEGELVVVLDCSGSMAEPGPEGTAFEEARSLLREWATWWPREAVLRVFPFAATAGPALDPRDPDGAARLAATRPHGPTALAEALEELLPTLGPDGSVVLLTDGRARLPEAAPEGWEGLGRSLADQGRRVLCVPAGAGADKSVLAALGEVVEEPARATLRSRLLEALSAPLQVGAGLARAEPGSLWTLPAAFPALGERDRFQAAPGAEWLLRDDSGAAAAALRRWERGILVGVAGQPEAHWIQDFAPLVEEFWGAPRLERRGNRVILRGDGEGWRAGPAGAAAPARPFDPLGSGLWEAGPFPPGAALQVHSPGGHRFDLPAAAADELAVTDGHWRQWLAAGTGKGAPAARPTFLAAALVSAVTALGLRRRGGSSSRGPRRGYPAPSREPDA